MTVPSPRARITIDMTPLLPAGQNGGAGLVAVSLIRELRDLAPTFHFTILTSAVTDAALASLDHDNVTRVCVVGPGDPKAKGTALRMGARQFGKAVLDRTLPAKTRIRVKNAFWAAVKQRNRAQTMHRLQSDLTFCPFTAPSFFEPRTPLVSIVYDQQYDRYPEFFDPEQRSYRHQHVVDACQRSTRVVCISEYVRQTLLASVKVPPDRVVTIPLTVLNPHSGLSALDQATLLGRLGLTQGRFLLYPANFWAHKNHLRLIQAHQRFRAAHPDSDLRIACTGTPNALMDNLRVQADTLSPGGIIFPGYVSQAELASLSGASAAIIYPSLYEGFGMPALEALAIGKPLLCSNVTSLPEVVGDAAVMFDPTDVSAMVSAIERLEYRPADVVAIANRGPQRARRFGTVTEMASRYLSLFEELLLDRHSSQAPHGLC